VSAGPSLVTTAADGSYTLAEVPAGSYTLTPERAGYRFSLASRAVTVNADLNGQDITVLAVGEAAEVYQIYVPLVVHECVCGVALLLLSLLPPRGDVLYAGALGSLRPLACRQGQVQLPVSAHCRRRARRGRHVAAGLRRLPRPRPAGRRILATVEAAIALACRRCSPPGHSLSAGPANALTTYALCRIRRHCRCTDSTTPPHAAKPSSST
jgi:hypothetical protein